MEHLSTWALGHLDAKYVYGLSEVVARDKAPRHVLAYFLSLSKFYSLKLANKEYLA